MKKLRQFDTLVIEELVKEQFHQPTHGQTYYELVYIFEGEGIHHLNANRIAYRANDLFLISPEDTHYLEIKTVTHFGVIKFTDSYFSEKPHLIINTLLKERPEAMMTNKALKEMRLTVDEVSQLLLRNTFQNLLACRENKDLNTSLFVFYQIVSLFGLLREMWARMNIPASWQPSKEALISFIHQHIYEPEKIQIKNLAHTFHISANYFSVYFKNNFGISYRQYVNNYRMKLIESRVLAGFTLRQIADEFGFSDESHLSHFFKKQHAITLSQFRLKDTGGQIP